LRDSVWRLCVAGIYCKVSVHLHLFFSPHKYTGGRLTA
jgi:hypothetical protein